MSRENFGKIGFDKYLGSRVINGLLMLLTGYDLWHILKS